MFNKLKKGQDPLFEKDNLVALYSFICIYFGLKCDQARWVSILWKLTFFGVFVNERCKFALCSLSARLPRIKLRGIELHAE